MGADGRVVTLYGLEVQDEGTAFILWLPRQAGETAGGNPVPARALAG